MGRPKEHGEETRAQLLEAAGNLLATEGSGALTVRRLADEVGTTTRAIYSLFGSKEGIISALYRQGVDIIVELHLAVPYSEDPTEEFLPLALAYRETARSHPNLYRLMFERAVPGFTPSHEDRIYARQSLTRLQYAVERSIAKGRFPPREVFRTTRQLWALVHGLAEYEREPDAVVLDRDEFREHLFGRRPFAEALVAEIDGGGIVGFALSSGAVALTMVATAVALRRLVPVNVLRPIAAPLAAAVVAASALAALTHLWIHDLGSLVLATAAAAAVYAALIVTASGAAWRLELVADWRTVWPGRA